ncbi:hypothetical protein [Serratia entomophila]|uniref:hypothetical protein n=1 Tax=Serratia entomophila TaxID=42906 RepID=UPI001F4BE674|nr:hypothetical protein [Serratia entomophila]ULG11682.1 hypothetical protein 440p1_00066 [Serratia entomophila]ULG11714.1 hypothetical protein 442p_00024 [Serratia entomophila]
MEKNYSVIGRFKEIIVIVVSSAKQVALGCFNLFQLMLFVPALFYGLYRIAIVLLGNYFSVEPYPLMSFMHFVVDLYSLIFPGLAVVGVVLIVGLSLFQMMSKVWRKSC